jgi:Phytoene/squalene synthetase
LGRFFLRGKTYLETAKLYAVWRGLDDIADLETDLDSKIRRIDEMRNFLKKYYNADNIEVHSSNENEKIAHDVITLAKNNDIKKIILEDLIDGVASDLKKRIHILSIKDLLVYSY